MEQIRDLCREALRDAHAAGGFASQREFVKELADLVAECQKEIMMKSPAWAAPNEVLARIFSHCDISTIRRCGLVCKRWNRIMENDRLWHVLYIYRWPDEGVDQDPYCPEGATWADRYRRRHLCEVAWQRGSCRARPCAKHDDLVTCLQFRGKRLISGSRDRSMRVWDLPGRENAESVMTFDGHQRTLFRLQFNDERLVSCSRDCTVRIWDSRTARELAVLQGHEAEVTCVQFDERRIVSGSRDRTIRVWDWQGELVAVLDGHERGVGCLQFEGDVLISGAGDNAVKIWDIPSRTCEHTLEGHDDKVLCLQFRGTRLVTGSKDSTICVWDLATLQRTQTLRGHQSWVHCLEFNDKRIVSGANDHSIKIWCTETWVCLYTLQRHRNTVRCLQMDNWRIISGSFDGTCIEWDFSPPTGETRRPEVITGGLDASDSSMENEPMEVADGTARVQRNGYDPFNQRIARR